VRASVPRARRSDAGRGGRYRGPRGAILPAVFKTCPRCGGEFQAWVVDCPDCGVALVTDAGAVVRRPAEPLPPASELVPVERGDPWQLRELAQRFQQEGLSCRIDVYPPDAPRRPPARGAPAGGTRFAVYVREVDVPRAEWIRSEHSKTSVPDGPASPTAPGTALAACPACGEPLAEGASGCASCGLEFPELGADE